MPELFLNHLYRRQRSIRTSMIMIIIILLINDRCQAIFWYQWPLWFIKNILTLLQLIITIWLFSHDLKTVSNIFNDSETDVLNLSFLFILFLSIHDIRRFWFADILFRVKIICNAEANQYIGYFSFWSLYFCWLL